MDCVYCGGKTGIANSRRSSKGSRVWRRRKCKGCRAIFTTGETVDIEQSVRVKRKTSALEPFISEKLYLSVHDSLSHRKTAYADAKQLTNTIISKLLPCKSGVLEDSEINEAALSVLKRFDKAAFTYYKAHHRDIQ